MNEVEIERRSKIHKGLQADLFGIMQKWGQHMTAAELVGAVTMNIHLFVLRQMVQGTDIVQSIRHMLDAQDTLQAFKRRGTT